MSAPSSQRNSQAPRVDREASSQNIPTLTLDASTWHSPYDIYTAFFHAVGAPDWHGRNLDALNDSILHGGINQIEYPYRIRIKGWKDMSDGAVEGSWKVVKFLRELGVEVLLEGEGGSD